MKYASFQRFLRVPSSSTSTSTSLSLIYFFFYFYSRSQRLQLSFLLDFVLRVERAEWSLLPLGGILLLLIITLASPLARSGGKCQVVVKFAT